MFPRAFGNVFLWGWGRGEGVNRVYFGGLKNTVIAFMSCETQGERIQELQSLPVNKRPSELI